MENLFEAFFWIEPTRSNLASPFSSTKVVWHYPDDVAVIATEFKHIPDFCFPDIEKIGLDKGESSKVQHIIFTLTDKNNVRSYGICLRGLFRGEGRRFDVKRRPKHCLCIISKYPYFSMFRILLSQIYSISLIEKKFGSAKRLLHYFYTNKNTILNNGHSNCYTIDMTSILYPSSELPPNRNQSIQFIENLFTLQLPLQDKLGYRQDATILPLVETLGVERFLLILTAILCEHRIIFIADDAETLSTSLLAVISMIYPFTWQSFFAPLLPTKLLEMASAPYPYLLGIRRYQLPALYKQAIGDVILVDLDSGECSTRGNIIVKDIIGDSGTTLKQASETLDMITRTAGGFASKLMKNLGGNSGSSNSTSNNNGAYSSNNTNDNNQNTGTFKDIIAYIISDLRTMLSSKPGSLSLTAVTSGLFRGDLPGVSKTSTEASKIQWELDSEKTIRDNLLLFFIYLFADLDECINMNFLMKQHTSNSTNKGNNNTQRHTGNYINQAYDFNMFLAKKQNTENAQINGFLADFIGTEMFIQFCDEKLISILTTENEKSKSGGGTAAHVGMGVRGVNGGGVSIMRADKNALMQGDNLYEIICEELKIKQLNPTIMNIKSILTYIRNYQEQVYSIQDQSSVLENSSKLKGISLHNLTIQLTGGLITNTDMSSSSNTTSTSGSNNTTNTSTNMNITNSTHNTTISTSSIRRASIDTYGNNLSDPSTTQQPAPSFYGSVNIYDNPIALATSTICQDSYSNIQFLKIMKTISVRLICCKAAGGKGTAGLAGKRALILLRSLLVEGSELVLSYAIDFIPLLRQIIHLADDGKKNINNGDNTNSGTSNSTSVSGFELLSLSTNYSIEIAPYARLVLRLIVDHHLLALQRQYSLLARSGTFPWKNYTVNTRSDLFSSYTKDKYTLSSFLASHKRYRPSTECGLTESVLSSSYALKKTKPTRISEEDKRDMLEDDYEEDPMPINSTHSSTTTTASTTTTGATYTNNVKLNMPTNRSKPDLMNSMALLEEEEEATDFVNHDGITTNPLQSTTTTTVSASSTSRSGVPISQQKPNKPPMKLNKPQETIDLISFSEDPLPLPTTTNMKTSTSTNSFDAFTASLPTTTTTANTTSFNRPNSLTTTTTATTGTTNLNKPSDGFDFKFTEEMKYRMVNKDTGEIFDIRYDFDKTIPKNGKAVSPKLLPPPPNNMIRNTSSSGFDPFLTTPTSVTMNSSGFTPSSSSSGSSFPTFTPTTITNTTMGVQVQPYPHTQTMNKPQLKPPMTANTVPDAFMPSQPMSTINHSFAPTMSYVTPGTGVSGGTVPFMSTGSNTMVQAFAPSTSSKVNPAADSISTVRHEGLASVAARDSKKVPDKKDPFSDLLDIKKV